MDSTYILDCSIIEQNLTIDTAFRNFKSFLEESEFKASIKQGHLALAERIIVFMIKEWSTRKPEERKLGFYLKTNTKALAKRCNSEKSGRTVYNQINRLVECGVILKKERTKGGIKIWVNPKTIIDSSELKRKKIQGLVLEPSVKKERTRNVDSVDKNTEEQHIIESNQNITWLSKIDSVSCSDLAKNFWKHAKKYLYHELSINDSREKALINLLEGCFKQKLKQWQGDLPELYFKTLYHLDKVRKWFADHPEVKIPDPYHYFSMSSCGFRFWKLEEMELVKKRKLRIQLIRKTIRIQCLNLVRSKSRLELMKKHLHLIQSVKDLTLSEWYRSNAFNLYTIMS